MANLKISELPTANAPTGAELMELVQGGINKKLLLSDLPGTTQAAEDVTFTPSGTISSTNVQDAIEELNADVIAVSGTVLGAQKLYLFNNFI